MTEAQKKAYREFIDYMAHLYTKYRYLFEEDGDQRQFIAG